MGPELGRVFYQLFNECAALHLKWHEYVVLFGTSPERIRLLNAAAPGFFKLAEDSLWEDVLLHLCRMTDKRREVSTVWKLASMVTAALRSEVQSRFRALSNATAFARDWRNRHLAHRNMDLALERSATPLAPASRQAVNEAIQALDDLLNCVECHYCDVAPIPYDFVSPIAGADDLLAVLERGLSPHARRFLEEPDQA